VRAAELRPWQNPLRRIHWRGEVEIEDLIPHSSMNLKPESSTYDTVDDHRGPAFFDRSSRRQFIAQTASLTAALAAGSFAHAQNPSSALAPNTELIAPGSRGVLDVLGPTVEFLTPPMQVDTAYTVLRGVMPPGSAVPLHSHPDDESFFLISGAAQGITEVGETFQWFDIPVGGFVHVPRGAKHAWRSISNEPVVQLIVTTPRLGRFFQEVGTPVPVGAPPRRPTAEDLKRFAQIANAYGHWLGTPEQNAAIGIQV
jgi:quercetin dioxygenase-like cupin family protein